MPPSYFSRQAKAYAQHRPAYPDALFEWIHKQVPHAECIWDCATGNGQAAKALAAYFSNIIATDHSQAQLDLAVKDPHVHYRLAEAHESGLDNNSIDIVVVAQALHWFYGDSFWSEVKRVLKPGGLFLAWTYAQHVFDLPALTAITNHYHDEILGDYWPARRKHPVNGYRDIEIPFTQIHTPTFSLEASHTLEDHLGYLRSWSGTQRYIDQHKKDPTRAIKTKLTQVWGDPLRKRKVSWPLTVIGGFFEI